MRYFFLSIAFFLSINSLAQKTMNYPKYTLGEVYEMIAKEETDTFTLKNANIVLDTIADRNILLSFDNLETLVPVGNDSIDISKSIVLENVYMQEITSENPYAVGFANVNFNKSILIKNSSLNITNCHFKSTVNVRFNDDLKESLKENFEDDDYGLLNFNSIIFEFDPRIGTESSSLEPLPVTLYLRSSTLKGTKVIRDIGWFLGGFGFAAIENNTFLNKHGNYIVFSGNSGRIINNDFGIRAVQIFIPDQGVKGLEVRENKLEEAFFLRLPESVQNLQLDWNQFLSGVTGMSRYGDFLINSGVLRDFDEYDLAFRSEEFLNKWLDSARVVNNRYYKSEIALLGTLNSIYKRQHDLESANGSYIALKDLETKRLRFLYYQNPSFDAFFKWKINQFLKIFSAYGTEPAKAITMSVFVVLVFALIYLFFPNYWDSHGKNRIMDRYRFFTKYMKRDSGMHEVYLEEKNNELMASEDFKSYMLESEKGIPQFFMATALPLYRWSVAGTRTFSWMLSKVDVLKGKWSDTEDSKRGIKSVLLIGAFIIALLYDIFIKVLNALMLSINTFTTLGFGEIPIKGLPRYLAIIQGFIGWFMLTIFSVSLISQLLN